MPIKNAIAKGWSLAPSADGRRWSRYPAGDAPTSNLAAAAAAGAVAAGAVAHTVPLAAIAAAAALASASLSAAGAAVTTFTLTTAASTGTYPFTLGQGFKEGEVSSVTTDLSACQVVIKSTWPDGSAKHAIISGRASLTSNVPLAVNVTAGTPPTGTLLTAADIATAAPSASLQCGAFGTVNLSSALASPVDTFVSGHEMVECRYRLDVGSGLSAFFDVRRWVNGVMWVGLTCENGFLDNGSGAVGGNVDRSYVPTFIVNGVTVYNNGGAALNHRKNTGWVAEGWIGTDPAITPGHNPTYMRASKLFPNYTYASPSAGTLNGLASTYTPMMQGQASAGMEGTGFGDWIGLLPNWNALYAATGDARALRATIVNSFATKGRPIVWRGKTSNLTPKPTDFPTWTVDGPAGPGYDTIYAGSYSWDLHHAPLEGYGAFILTGDRRHLDTLAQCASTFFFYESSARGSGVNRLFQNGQVRGIAWALRTVGAYCAIAPTGDAVAADYRTWLNNGYAYWAGQGPSNGSASQLGLPVAISTYDPAQPLSQAPWMYHFWIASNGFVSDIKPGIANMSNLLALRDWMYKAVVGILGGNGAPNFCYTAASSYNYTISSDVVASFAVTTPDRFYATWGEVFTATFGSSNTSCGTALGGSGSGTPDLAPTGYWGNLLPAIAYAVDHGAANAAAAYLRITAATNYATLNTAGFDDVPVWGIKPRQGIHALQAAAAAQAVVSAAMAHTVPLAGAATGGGAAAGSLPTPGQPAYRAGKSLNTWYPMANTSFAAAMASYADPLGSTPFGGVRKDNAGSYSGACVELGGTKMYFPRGGGHTDYAGNEVLVVDWGADAPVPVLLRAPTTNGNISEGVRYYADGRPISTHTYWECWHTSNDNRIYFLGTGSIWNSAGGANPNCEAYDLSANDYLAAGHGIPNVPTGAYNPDIPHCQDTSGNVYVHTKDGGNVCKFNPVTRTWTNFSAPTTGGQFPICYDSTRNRLVHLAGSGWGRIYNAPQGLDTNSAFNFTGTHASVLEGGGFSAVYVPDLDRFIASPWSDSNSTLYQIHPTTGDVSVFTVASTPPPKFLPSQGDGSAFNNAYGRFNIIPTLKLIVSRSNLPTSTNYYYFFYA